MIVVDFVVDFGVNSTIDCDQVASYFYQKINRFYP